MDTDDPREEEATGFLMDLEFARIHRQGQSTDTRTVPVNLHVGPAMTVSANRIRLFLSTNARDCLTGHASFHGLGSFESHTDEGQL